MKKFTSILTLSAVLLTVIGCATTDDPRQGGLFGYNPAAYERRIAERETKLAALKQEGASETQRTARLKQDQVRKQGEKDAATRNLAELDQQIDAIEQKISSTRIQTKAQQQKHDKISSRLDQVKRQMAGAKSGDDAEKRQEIDRLNAEIDRLLQEADALSTM